MNYSIFRDKLKKYPFFHSNIFVHFTNNLNMLRRQISEWIHKGYIITLKRGFYTLCDKDRSVKFSNYFLSNQLYSPSYVSLESALSYYNFIPERVHAITSISTKKTQKFQNSLGTFIYYNIKPELYDNFLSQIDEFGYNFLIATPERALIDFLYYKVRGLKKIDITIFDNSFRLQNLDLLDKKKLKKIAQQFNNQKLLKITLMLIKYMENQNA